LSYTLGQNQLDNIEEVLQQDLIDIGVRCVLAALAAGNFGAVSAMAKIIGEGEFSLLFHKGKKENIHFNKIISDFLLITIFSNDLSLGFLRLKVNEAVERIKRELEAMHAP
jgi:predicted regulator of Ras-like GTPase activity (Roadblock/LC7/MglB family)